MQKIQLIIPEELANTRLDKTCSLLCDLSRTKIQELIGQSHVLVNDKTILLANFKLKEQDKIEISIPPEDYSHITAKEVEFEIVYEDNHLMVINKPAGLVVHPGNGNHDNTLINGLIAYCQNQLSTIGGVTRPGIVHRLDKDTSGLMLVAKSDFIHLELAKQISQRLVERIYLAIIWGLPLKTSDTIETFIGRSQIDRLRMQVTRCGKIATTHYRVIRPLAEKAACLIECKLSTGRTHQIRVHMSHIGHSIIGDQTYGHNSRKIGQIDHKYRASVAKIQRQALHSHKLSFTHPYSKEIMTFESEMPQDLQELLDELS